MQGVMLELTVIGRDASWHVKSSTSLGNR